LITTDWQVAKVVLFNTASEVPYFPNLQTGLKFIRPIASGNWPVMLTSVGFEARIVFGYAECSVTS
jgi:hypothetical protein